MASSPLAPHTVTQPLEIRLLLIPVALLLAGLLALYSYLAWQWPLMREAHYLHYIAYLINEHGFAPYRDIFETSWFGTFLFHMFIGNVAGYSAAGFRYVDTVLLLLLMLVWWRILRRLDNLLAIIAALSLGLLYLHTGPANSLQRDYLNLLPISLALLMALQVNVSPRWRGVCIGFLFGLAASVKPHAVIGLPVVLWVTHTLAPAQRCSFFALTGHTLLGGLCTFALGFLWLGDQGALSDFFDMTFHYLPLYQSFDGAHHIVNTTERLQQSWHWWKHFTWVWPLPILFGLWRGWHLTAAGSQRRALVCALPALALCYNLYPLLAGKFWDYHWVPYSCFAILTSTLLLIPPPVQTFSQRSFSFICAAGFFYFAHSQYLPWRGYFEQWQHYPDIRIPTTHDDELAHFIRVNTPSGSTVQTIDQGGPSYQWLLKAGAVHATPYPGSFLFLHHQDSPYVQAAQEKFMQKLHDKPPGLIIVMTDFTRPHGPGTRTDIPGFQSFLKKRYHPIRQEAQFTIWARNTGVTPPTEPAVPEATLHSEQASPP